MENTGFKIESCIFILYITERIRLGGVSQSVSEASLPSE